MNVQRTVKNALLIFALASIAYLIVEDQWARQGADPASEMFPATARLVVYYFDQGKDCTTCQQIPAYTEAVLNAHFADALRDETLVWRSVDTDLPRNEHFLSEYKLYTKSIVLVTLDHGTPVEWKNLDKVWDLIYDRKAFEQYLQKEITEALGATRP